jgi:hypothetical protein
VRQVLYRAVTEAGVLDLSSVSLFYGLLYRTVIELFVSMESRWFDR